MAIRLITGSLQQWSDVCKNNFTKEDSMRYTKLQKMFVTTCDVHKPPQYATQVSIVWLGPCSLAGVESWTLQVC